MKNLLLCSILIIPMLCAGQITQKMPKIYAIVTYSGDIAKINYGTESKFRALKNQEGRNLKFYSLAGVINYLTSIGWKFEENSAELYGLMAGLEGETTFIISYYCPLNFFERLKN